MQQTIEFENELIKRWPPDEPKARSTEETSSQVNVVDGKVEVAASGSASDIKKKYAKEKDEDQRNQEVFANLQKKKAEKKDAESNIKARVYKFEGVISECFEPYLMSYSDQEQQKIVGALEKIMTEGVDQLETIDYVVYGSSLHLFKNIKASMKRCVSFSKGKALFNLQLAFKNVF